MSIEALRKIKKGQRIVYYEGRTPEATDGKANQVLLFARELYALKKVTLFQKAIARGPNVNGCISGLTTFQYIAEGI